MSQALPCGLFTPRWSVVRGGLAGAQRLLPFGMASSAGLPFSKAIVWVGPPLLAKVLASLGLVLFLEVGWMNRQVRSLEMLKPLSVIVPWQFPPEGLLATIVLRSLAVAAVPKLEIPPPLLGSALLPENVSLV